VLFNGCGDGVGTGGEVPCPRAGDVGTGTLSQRKNRWEV
jgi:hypothetical protein